MFSSFKDEPDDQESFAFADDSETETNTTARMFSMAVVDGESCHTHSQCHIKVLYPLELTFLLKSMYKYSYEYFLLIILMEYLSITK